MSQSPSIQPPRPGGGTGQNWHRGQSRYGGPAPQPSPLTAIVAAVAGFVCVAISIIPIVGDTAYLVPAAGGNLGSRLILVGVAGLLVSDLLLLGGGMMILLRVPAGRPLIIIGAVVTVVLAVFSLAVRASEGATPIVVTDVLALVAAPVAFVCAVLPATDRYLRSRRAR